MDLTIEMVDPAELRPNAWNPNEQTARVTEAMSESITEFSFIDPVLVRPHPDGTGYEIIDGEHRYDAALALGADRIPVIVRDLSDTDAKRLTIILNETRGHADTIGLAQLLANLAEDIPVVELRMGLPYSADELDDLIRVADVNWTPRDTDTGGVPAEPDEWETFQVKMPRGSFDVWTQARDLVADGVDLHADAAISAGQVIEALCADFLAGPSRDPLVSSP